ncbi:hypothetical protein CEXT_741881 [Caerostris extrusa]|uniref:Uncharacterized protein n=1 Tax=Caerostris extrusa TaxID=172846 RepID=A0AAV4VEK1_CAEEX|nr:hypothetical protein CEXT_741881 [Caerostris extrusa]
MSKQNKRANTFSTHKKQMKKELSEIKIRLTCFSESVPVARSWNYSEDILPRSMRRGERKQDPHKLSRHKNEQRWEQGSDTFVGVCAVERTGKQKRNRNISILNEAWK